MHKLGLSVGVFLMLTLQQPFHAEGVDKMSNHLYIEQRKRSHLSHSE
jgi:hypothetical protein